MQIRKARPTDAGPMARVHVDTWRTAYAGIISAEVLAGLSYRDREASWNDILAADQAGTANIVAETGDGRIIGFAGGGPERGDNQTYRGELYAIYLLRRYQRKGVGHRLVAAVAQHLLDESFCSMLVWVLEDNHSACRFYEALGGVQVGRKSIVIGGSSLMEVSYGRMAGYCRLGIRTRNLTARYLAVHNFSSCTAGNMAVAGSDGNSWTAMDGQQMSNEARQSSCTACSCPS